MRARADALSEDIMKAVIPAAGLGTRFLPASLAKGRVEPALFNAYHALELACKAAILAATGPKRGIHDPPHNLEIQREHY